MNKDWVIIDADGLVLGRLASTVARIIRGKHKTNFTAHVDCGDNVIVLNAEKIKLTGMKWDQKEYITHTGYPGGQRSILAKDLIKKRPVAMVERAVRKMLPTNKLGRALFRNLHVYTGTEHPHEAQKPRQIKLDTIK